MKKKSPPGGTGKQGGINSRNNIETTTNIKSPLLLKSAEKYPVHTILLSHHRELTEDVLHEILNFVRWRHVATALDIWEHIHGIYEQRTYFTFHEIFKAIYYLKNRKFIELLNQGAPRTSQKYRIQRRGRVP